MNKDNIIDTINDFDGCIPFIKPLFNKKCDLSGGELVIAGNNGTDRHYSFSQLANIEHSHTNDFKLTNFFLESVAFNFVTPYEVELFDLYININLNVLKDNEINFHLHHFIKVMLKRDRNLRINLVIVEKQSFIEMSEKYIDTIISYKRIGARIILRCFEENQANIHYMSRFKLDGIFIDKKITQSLSRNTYKREALDNIIYLAKESNLSVAIEGIDSILQYVSFSKYHDVFFQGDLLCPAMSLDKFKKESIRYTNKIYFDSVTSN